MSNGDLNWIANFIWGIADDVLRDLYVRGKYRDVILPMTVLRRLDAVLEPTKKAVLDMKASLDKAGSPTRIRRSDKLRASPFITPPILRSAIFAPVRANSSLRLTSKLISTVTRPTSKRSSIILSFAIRSRAFRKRTRLGP
jgi:HsdM N-terminal domain